MNNQIARRCGLIFLKVLFSRKHYFCCEIYKILQCVRNVKERKLQNNATSSYFTEQADGLQTSSVKRKKTTLRKM